MKAIDISNWQPVPTPAQLEFLKTQGVTRGIVGVSYGNVGSMQLAAMRDAGLEIQAYAWLKFPFVLNEQEMIRAYNLIRDLPVTRLWIDVEDVPTAAYANAADVKAAIQWWKVQRPDLPVGIYTADWWWKWNMADVFDTFDVPLWVAYYPSEPPDLASLEAYLPGHWQLSDVDMWQYANGGPGDLEADWSLIIGDGRMKYDDAKLDEIFTNILGNAAQNGAMINSLGHGLGQVAQDFYAHIYNNGDFTRSQQEVLERLQAQIDTLKAANEKFIADVAAAAKAFGDGN